MKCTCDVKNDKQTGHFGDCDLIAASVVAVIADGLDASTDGRGWNIDHQRAADLANAAPEMLALLKFMAEYFEKGNRPSPSALWGDGDNPVTLKQAVNQVIAKAERREGQL